MSYASALAESYAAVSLRLRGAPPPRAPMPIPPAPVVAAPPPPPRISRPALPPLESLPWRIITREVVIKHGLSSVKDLLGRERRIEVVLARREAFYRIYTELPNTSLTKIGRWFGRDHTTVLNAIRMHTASLQEVA